MILRVYGAPQPKGSKTIGRTKSGAAFVREANKKTVPWVRQVAQAAGETESPTLTGPVHLTCMFYVARPKSHYGTGRNADKLKASAPLQPTTKPDLSKLVRSIEDALIGIAYVDDAQVVGQTAQKLYGTPARVEIIVQPIGETDDV